jgi:hypothetical protein
MKKTIVLLAMILTSYCGMSQTRDLTGGAGIPFGVPFDSIKIYMADKHPDAKFYDYSSRGINFMDGKFAGYKVLLWMFQATKQTGVHTIMICFDVEESNVYEAFDAVSAMLDEKYGSHENIERYDYPYTKQDKGKFDESMYRLGKAHMNNYWKFNGSDPSMPDKHNYINVTITKNFNVQVTYQDGPRVSKASDMEKSKNIKDL